MEAGQLASSLVEATREGRAQDWVERIAGIAQEAGLPLEEISWQGAPKIVAFNVVEAAKRRRKLGEVEEILRGV